MTPPIHIPWPYKAMFLYFEPLAAFNGAVMTLTRPVSYLQVMSPMATLSTYSPLEQPVYDQIAALLVLFAWCQAIVLRVTSEIRVWKYLLFGMLICDVIHLYAAYQILGPQIFFDPRRWRLEEWVNFVMLYGPGTLRLGVCLGVGLGEEKIGGKKVY